MDNENPINDFVRGASEELVRQLLPDFKAWAIGATRWVEKCYKKASIKLYNSPEALLDALNKNVIKEGDWVTLECKPTLFGPFLRRHFLSPIIGNNTSLRLGPPLIHTNPIMGLMAQITSNLTPVGLYPPLDEGLSQACLYPSDSKTFGFIGLLPGVSNMVQYIPAILAPRHTPHCNMPCHVTGVIRLIDMHSLTKAGFSPEIYEEIRQSGNIWFLDATHEDSECNPLGEAVTTELWGGLYSSGHLEIVSGSLKHDRIIEAFCSALESEGLKPQVSSNSAGRQEFLVFAKGVRICIDSKAPFYSLHMDSELALNFNKARTRFDRICCNALKNITQICKDDSVELKNENDLDFSYTDTTNAFTVLKSLGAENISNPLMIAIRDWHRRRGS